MPLYDHECQHCENVFEEFLPYEIRRTVCPKCDGPAVRIVSKTKLDLFKPQHFEELGDDNPYITSKAQLARECETRGLKSRLLMEGYKNYQSPKWA